MAKPRYELRDGVWYRVFQDDRNRERKIKATEAELARAGIDTTSSPATPPAKTPAAAPAAAKGAPAEAPGSTEPDEEAAGTGSASSGSLWLGLAVGAAIVAAAAAAFLLWPRNAAEGNDAGGERPPLQMLPGGVS